MPTPRITTTDRLNEHESRLDGHDTALTIIQEQFTAFQTLVQQQLDTMNKVVDGLKDTKESVIRLEERSGFDDWKRAITVGIVMTGIGSFAGIASTLVYQALQHLHP